MATRRMERPLARGLEAAGSEPASERSLLGADPVASAAGQQNGGAPAAVTFEQAIARLGEIVESLEQGEQPLEESLALFEEGMRLAHDSRQILERAERRIEELLGVDGQGRPIVRELEPE